MARYLDENGLLTLVNETKKYVTDITGIGYNIAGDSKNIKEYIDSRIFVGSAADVELALSQKKIDETTFTMVVDEDGEEITAIPRADIDNLFK